MIEELKLPNFFHAEIPIKDGSFQDQRAWIYCPQALSLIEIIPEDETVTAINRDLVQKKFIYENPDCFPEEFRLVIAQNNCELAGVDPVELLYKAWLWYEQYLIWEDAQLDEN
jgi:hypothetical protein